MQYLIPTPCLLKSGDKSSLMNKRKLMNAFHIKFQQTLKTVEYVVPVCDCTWNRLCCGSVIIFALHNCESRPLWWWWWCHVIYSLAVKKMDTFFGCVGGKIRLLRCVLLVAFCAVRSVLLHALGIRCVVAVRPLEVPVSVRCPLTLAKRTFRRQKTYLKHKTSEIATPLCYKNMSINIPDVLDSYDRASWAKYEERRPTRCNN